MHWRSLKTRITLMVVAGLLVSLWTLTWMISIQLSKDLQELVGEQQLSTVTVVAHDLDSKFALRIAALQSIAAEIDADSMAEPLRLQRLFQNRPTLQMLFNGGTLVTNTEAVAIASVPEALGRVGISYADRPYIAFSLKHGKPRVSDPVIGKAIKQPVISIAVPILNTQRGVIGTLVGVVNLSLENFLSSVIDVRFAKSGSYLLIDRDTLRVVVATDKRLNLTDVTQLARGPMTEGFLAGRSDHGVLVDARGAAFMSAAKEVTSTGWVVVALQPLEDALAPLRTLQLSLMVTALVLTMLAAALMLWLLSRELTPVRATVATLTGLRGSKQFPDSLPLPGTDEIDEVVLGFNHLLDTLRLQDHTLRASEALLQDTQMIAGVGSYALNGENGTWTSSDVLDALFGIDSGYQRNIAGWLALIHRDDQQRMSEYLAGLLSNRRNNFDQSYRIVRANDGATRWVHGQGRLEFDGHGQFLTMRGAVQDITHTVEQELRLRKLSSITEQAPIAIVITDLQGNIEYVNPFFEQITGYRLAELIGKNPRVLQSGQTAPALYEDMWRTLAEGHVWRGDLHNRKKAGDLFTERSLIAPVVDPNGAVTHYVALKEDITEERRREGALRDSLKEKTALLNEVHHRVKNNLQVISSLLRLEAGRSTERAVQSVLNDMTGRIRSMALVHETLYRSGNFSQVDLRHYVQQVATAAFRAQVRSGSAIRLLLELEPVHSALDQATPCGLIVNELISNCLKHGLAGMGQGEVRVVLKVLPATDRLAAQARLTVSDNGTGLPADFEARHSKSLGLQLVSDLAGQLGGRLEIESGRAAGSDATELAGARLTVTFALVAS